MRKRMWGLALMGATMLGGCAATGGSDAEDQLVGTWRGRDAATPAPFQFASVTFAPDGTYTAQMRYRDQLRADSGRWSYEGETLYIGEGDRRYEADVRGRELIVRDPESNISVTLDRLR